VLLSRIKTPFDTIVAGRSLVNDLDFVLVCFKHASRLLRVSVCVSRSLVTHLGKDLILTDRPKRTLMLVQGIHPVFLEFS